jgi:hypothetical protein
MVVILLPSTVILLLRTYALWNRNHLILILHGTVGLGIPGIGIVSSVIASFSQLLMPTLIVEHCTDKLRSI